MDEIAAAVGADTESLYRLLRALADLDVFRELDGRRFALAEAGELLRTDVPGSMHGWAVFVGTPMHRDAWTDLQESIRTGEPAFERVHGQLAFDHFASDPDDGALLDAAMTSIASQLIAPIVGCYDFSAFDTIVDVGGGSGALLAAVLAANPRARGVLYDLPHVIERAGAPLEEAGVRDRCELVGGDFFDSVPPGDAYLLSNVIHDWDDERATRILDRCRAALPEGGRVLLAEDVLPTGTEPSPAKWIDLEMLVMGTGRQRTEDDYRRLFERAGLALFDVVPCVGSLCVVEASRAGT